MSAQLHRPGTVTISPRLWGARCDTDPRLSMPNRNEILRCMVIADPSREAAEHVADQTRRLAEERLIAGDGKETLSLVARNRPEILLLSLELKRPEAVDVAKKVRKILPETFVVAVFRELAVPMMNKLDKAGVEDFIPQPIDFAQLFRAASDRFGRGFRRHNRYGVTIDVMRADGVLIGKTQDVSEGGIRMESLHPVHVDQSMLVDLVLPADVGKVRVRCKVLGVDGAPPKQVSARAMFQNLRGEDHRRLTKYLGSLEDDLVDVPSEAE